MRCGFRTLLLLAACALAPCSAATPDRSASRETAEKSNILVIIAERLSPDGRPTASTPHLNALAATGTTFTRAYAQSTAPVESRQSLLSGQRPEFRAGFAPVTLAEHFKSHGYRSAIIPNPPTRHADVEGITDAAIGELRRGSGVPFFLVVAYPRKQDAPDERAVPERASESPDAHLARVHALDAQVGRLMAEIDRGAAGQHTVVVLCASSGYVDRQERSNRAMMLERELRVPLVVRIPGHPTSGMILANLVELVDIYPTLTDLAGISNPCGLQGTSLVPLLKRPDGPWKHAAFGKFGARGGTGPSQEGTTTRTNRYRLVRTQGTGAAPKEIYDHLAGTEAVPAEVREELHRLHQRHFASWRTPVQLSVWEWAKSREVALRSGETAMSLGFYEWTFFDAIKRGEHQHGQRLPQVVSSRPDEIVLSVPDEGQRLTIKAVSDGAELTLTVTNLSDHDWPEEAGVIPCFNAGIGEHRSEAFVNFRTYFSGPDGLELLEGREIHFNRELHERVAARARSGRHPFSRKWPIAQPHVEEGIIIRESSDCRWVSGIAWERFISSQGNNVRVCMHLGVQVGPLKRGESRTIRGKAYLFEGDKEECLRRYRADFK